MARRKIVFVMVEGLSDETALTIFFEKFFKDSAVKIEVLRTDITTQKGTTTRNILDKIAAVVKHYADNKFKSADFLKIIHIVDMDGAYITDDIIEEDDTCKEFLYYEDKIVASKKEFVSERNAQKRSILNRLSTTSSIWNIPYSIYYMSCNLDHAFYNKLNLSDEEKEKYSFEFAQKYKNNIEGFLNFIKNSDFSVNNSYQLSWEYIKKENRSLKRHTNIGLCFNK